MARYYVRIGNISEPKRFISFAVDQSAGIDSVVDYAEMMRARVYEDCKGSINILRIPLGYSADDTTLLEQYDAVDLIYVDRHVPAMSPLSRDFSGEGFCA